MSADRRAGARPRVAPGAVAPQEPVADVVEVRGARLAVRRTAAHGTVRAVAVLVHGLASNARMWDACAAALAGHGVASVAVDLREHGASAALAGPDQEPVDTGVAAADVAVLTSLERVVGGAGSPTAAEATVALPVVLAGQSWGGNVVLEAVAQHAAPAAALALVDGGWLRFDQHEPFERLWQRLAPPGWGGATLDEVRARMAAVLDGWGPHALPAVLGNLTTDADGQVRNVLPLASHERILRSMYERDPRTLYPRVAQPVLLAPAGGPAGARVAEAVDGLARPVLRPYEGAHHDLHLQHPARLAADLVALLEEGGPR